MLQTTDSMVDTDMSYMYVYIAPRCSSNELNTTALII